LWWGSLLLGVCRKALGIPQRVSCRKSTQLNRPG